MLDSSYSTLKFSSRCRSQFFICGIERAPNVATTRVAYGSQLQAHKVAIAIINFNRGSELDSNFNNAHYNIVGAYLTATNTSSSRNMQKRRTRWAHRFRFARLPEARSLLEVEHPDRRGDRRASGRRSH